MSEIKISGSSIIQTSSKMHILVLNDPRSQSAAEPTFAVLQAAEISHSFAWRIMAPLADCGEAAFGERSIEAGIQIPANMIANTMRI